MVGAHGQRAGRASGPVDRDRRGVRQGAARLRGADRLVPGCGPRPGRCGHRRSTAARSSPGKRRGRPTRSRTGRAAGRLWRAGSVPRRPARPATAACTTTAATGSCSSSTSSCTSGEPRPGRRVFGEPSRMYARGAADRLSTTQNGAADDGLPLGRAQRGVPERGPAVPGRSISPTRCGSGCTRTGVHHNWDFHRARSSTGWLAPGWPEEFGGQGRDRARDAGLRWRSSSAPGRPPTAWARR